MTLLTNNMNVLMLNYEFPPIGGGAGNAHLCLLKEYAEKTDLKVHVLTSAPKPGASAEKFAENITIYKVGIHKKNLHYWRKTEVVEWLIKAQFHYRRLLRENDYDLAHAFFGFPTGWLCYRSANKLPYIISLRGSDVPGKHARLKLDYRILAPVFRRIWKNAAALVVCSKGLRDRAGNFLPSVSIDVIPNGVDLDRFGPSENAERSETLKLLTVGRLSATKRVEMLIEAVEILHNDGLDVRLTIAGGGALGEQLRRIILQKQLHDVIEMTGRVEPEDMPTLYRQSDIFVSATMQEGMSNAMLEAMACALPIITTPCEGAEELITDNGTVVEDDSARTIAEAVRRLAEDRQRYEQMSKAARSGAERFTWKAVADKYLRCYNTVIESSLGSDL